MNCLNQEKQPVRCLFGTDGVRDVANRGLLTPEMVLRLGRAYVMHLIGKGYSRPAVVVGRDTRRSGEMLEAALAAGMTSAGAEVISLGVAPTPGVSFAAKELECQGGAVISASHNPAEYNGVKFLDENGCKLSDAEEAGIEDAFGDTLVDDWRPTGASIGRISRVENAMEAYAAWLERIITPETRMRSMNVCMDCAQGAAFTIAPRVFRNCLESVETIGDEPDGLNINEGFGVMSMGGLSRKVVEGQFDCGLAFDGDADRVLFTDGRGRILDGDIMLWVIGRWMLGEGKLGAGVVATIMSNMALEEHLAKEEIKVFRCQVGDRYVLDSMKRSQCGLGGEQSGHIIARGFAATGDGPCTALLFLKACEDLGEDLNSLVDRFSRYPQILRNVPVTDKQLVMGSRQVKDAVEMAEADLEGAGRIVLRPSGTEPLVRILVEARDQALLEKTVRSTEEAINEACREFKAAGGDVHAVL